MTSQAVETHNTDISENTETVLTSLDRCDACGAQAYVAVSLAESELFFCAHHAAKHKEKLMPIAKNWHDETHKLHQ